MVKKRVNVVDQGDQIPYSLSKPSFSRTRNKTLGEIHRLLLKIVQEHHIICSIPTWKQVKHLKNGLLHSFSDGTKEK